MKKKAKKKVPAKKSANASKKKINTKPAAKTSAKHAVTPLGDRVLLKPVQAEEMTSFGIIIPDAAKEKPDQGIVIAVGAGKYTDDGKLIPTTVKAGDKVMFSKYGYDEIKVNGVEYYIVSESSILAILN